jgi:ribosomal protein S18 acetylase RimI-like enzyme
MRERLGFRPETSADESFLYRLYISTREPEMQMVDWPADQKTTFLRQQFSAQTHHYRTNYPGAEFSIVLLDGRPVGRLYVHRRPDDIRIMDILLAPESRGSGIGTILLHDILQSAVGEGRSVSIHVEQDNPALRLYERLGFQRADTFGVYLLMVWKPRSGDQLNAAS